MLELPEVITLSKQVNNALSGKQSRRYLMPPNRISLRSITVNRRSMVNCS